ncbi:hypothetical protein [Streptomyces fagopyri]|uniref:hypothetical protein n=1 Tax=Streptomyces fagopyri TaxID=2662397 RepID=UPI003719585C
MRHEDWAVAERELSVVPRLNDNGARTKSATARPIPVSAELIRLYADASAAEDGASLLARLDLSHRRVRGGAWATRALAVTGSDDDMVRVWELASPGASASRGGPTLSGFYDL